MVRGAAGEMTGNAVDGVDNFETNWSIGSALCSGTAVTVAVAFAIVEDLGGRMTKTHSLPRAWHLLHGCCKSHFTLELAQAWQDRRLVRLAWDLESP